MNETALNQTARTTTSDDYIKSERLGSVRQELVEGRLSSKPAANRRHNLIATNVALAVGSRNQGGKSEIYVNGMMVQLNAKLVCYPDVVIVNGNPSFTDSREDVLVNPTVAVEIFSGSTNPFDKTRKLESYLAIASIKECLLIKADEMRVEHYARQNAKQWLYRIYDERDDVISLDSAGVKISLAEIYAHLKVKPAEMSSKAIN